MALPQPAHDWIPDLDTIDLSYMLSSFSHTLLGQLPNELLEIVTQHLHRPDLAAVARISPVLRALAERQLYRCLEPFSQAAATDFLSSRNSSNRSRRGNNIGRLVIRGGRHEHLKRPRKDGMALYLLYRTLSIRPDLCDMIKMASLDVVKRSITVSIPSTRMYSGGLPFTSNIDVALSEANIAGALLQLLQSVERLSVQLYDVDFVAQYEHDDSMSDCLSELFPGFLRRDAHSVPFTGLQKLKTLHWIGREFHWILAKSPFLLELTLLSNCQVLSDNAPHETSDSLQVLQYVSRSSIFSPGVHYYEHLKPFLAHFVSLQCLELTIDDRNANAISQDDISFENEGVLSLLLEKLDPLRLTLKDLTIKCVDTDVQSSDWLRFTQPDNFKRFKVLEYLRVPYTCLFGQVDEQWSHIVPTPTSLLPPSLKSLIIYGPMLNILDFLAKLRYFQDKMPALKTIELECVKTTGYQYNEIVFENHLHPAYSILRSIDIDLQIRCREGHWDATWDDYDLKALDLAAWQDSFGVFTSGIKLEPQEEPEDDLEDLVRYMHIAKRPRKTRVAKAHTKPTLNWKPSSWTLKKRKNMAKHDPLFQAAVHANIGRMVKPDVEHVSDFDEITWAPEEVWGDPNGHLSLW